MLRILLLCSLLFHTYSATALDQADIVQGLEALGDWEAAYPLAVNVAQTENSYHAWREVATKYRDYDHDHHAYLAAWQAAQTLNAEQAYRDFLTLRTQSPLNAQAIHALYQLTRELDTIQGYLGFMKDFPNTPEAVQALLRVHEIAFKRAQEKNEPEVYDAFVQTFTGAKQIPQAVELAYQAEKTALQAEIDGAWYDLSAKFFADENRERVARRIFNQARDAEKTGTMLVAERKYRLLDEWEAFKDTKAYTEHLDRQERLDYRQRQAEREKQLAAQIDTLRTAVVQTVQNEHAALRQAVQAQGDKITREVRLQGERMEDALLAHNQMLQQQFAAVGAQLDATNQRVDKQIGQVYNDMGNALSQVQHQMNAQVGAISNALNAQTAAMQQAAYENNRQNEVLFQRASEQQYSEGRKNRRCGEMLAKYGKYRMFSGCP